MKKTLLSFALLLASAFRAHAAPTLDPVALVNKADVFKEGLTGVSLTAVIEVVDTAGKPDKQVYRVLNEIKSGDSFIVISSESPAINGMVYIIKGNTVFAASPNERSFKRVGAMNLTRRVAGSLFSNSDLQGNVLLGVEYTPKVVKEEAGKVDVELEGKSGSQYKKIDGTIDMKNGLFTHTNLFDDNGLLKTADYDKFRSLGTKTKRRVPTVITMMRAKGRDSGLPAKSSFKITEAEFDPKVTYAEELAMTDANLQRLRSRYVLGGDALRSTLAEAGD